MRVPADSRSTVWVPNVTLNSVQDQGCTMQTRRSCYQLVESAIRHHFYCRLVVVFHAWLHHANTITKLIQAWMFERCVPSTNIMDDITMISKSSPHPMTSAMSKFRSSARRPVRPLIHRATLNERSHSRTTYDAFSVRWVNCSVVSREIRADQSVQAEFVCLPGVV